MVGYLVDNDVLSELRKGPRCNRGVAEWHGSLQPDDPPFLSVLVVGEIGRGIEALHRRDAPAAARLRHWLDEVRATFAARVLPINEAIADEWARITAHRTVPVIDGLLAATARVHRLTLVTRNVADVKDLGVELLNPFILRAR